MQIVHISTCRDERSASLEATNAGAPEKILTFFDWLSEKRPIRSFRSLTKNMDVE